MPVPRGDVPLTDCISRFETELRRAVWEIALAVLAKEVARRNADAASARKKQPARRAPKTSSAGSNGARPRAQRSSAQIALDLGDGVAPSAPVEPTISEAAPGDSLAAAASPAQPLDAEPQKKGRAAWTRDRVVEELANWLMQDPVIDAATLTRRGQSSLVAAARRLFGRFDAALNAANLHLAELYPDGPPKRGRMSAAA